MTIAPDGIVVRFDMSEEAVAKMEKLAQEIRNYSLNVDFSTSKGQLPDSLRVLAGALKQYGEDYAGFVEKCAQAVRSGGVKFRESDEHAASLMWGGN